MTVVNPSMTRFWVHSLVSGLVLGSLSNVTSAQTLEEVVVTADKRGAASVQDIPFSVQSVGGASLQESGALDFMDYFRQVPGLSMSDQGLGSSNYIIRGISSTGAGTVGLYFDEVIVTGVGLNDNGLQTDIKMFDMDRVEVLKGPQGTTFGSSSLSGTIRWIPNTAEYGSFKAESGVGMHTLRHSDDFGWQVDGMINVPIGDRAAIRLSGLLMEKAGYIDNRFEDDANRQDARAARAMGSWLITDDLELSVLGMFQKAVTGTRHYFNDTAASLPLSDTLNGQDLPGEYYQAVSSRAGTQDDTNLYSGKLVLDKPWGTVTGTVSVFDRSLRRMTDTGANSEILFGLPADENPSSLIQELDRRVTSSEVRFASNWNSAFQVLVGAFAQQEDYDQATLFSFTDPVTGRIVDSSAEAARRETHRTTDEIAVFGEVAWNITDRLALVGGARWFEFKVDEQVNTIMGYIYLPGSGLAAPLHFGFDDVIFKANLSYKLTDDILVFTQVAEGYRAGGPNDRSPMDRANVFIPEGFDSDSVTNYEIGVKSSLLGNQLRLNGSVFLMDWANIQLVQRAISPEGLSFAYRGNGGGAEVKGVELEIDASLSERMNIGAGFSYLDAKLTKDMPNPVEGLAGDTLTFTPEFSGNVNARYEWPLSDGLTTGFIAGDWSYYGETVNQRRPTHRDYRVQKGYSIANIRGGVKRGDWSLVVAVDNVFDTDEITAYSMDSTPQPAGSPVWIPENKTRPWPRMLSVTFRKQFL